MALDHQATPEKVYFSADQRHKIDELIRAAQSRAARDLREEVGQLREDRTACLDTIQRLREDLAASRSTARALRVEIGATKEQLARVRRTLVQRVLPLTPGPTEVSRHAA